MGMSDCIHCWETPCMCGYGYRDYSNEKTLELISAILSYKDKDNRLMIIKGYLDGDFEKKKGIK